ncbi:uncharacterized protein LOC128180476 [Crassostrea angulata]|uniref:uncharacterized protein LOC128180476 n=1 Tax=Magallana angulata TaxID=2784310 RepID=UPI0022B0BCD4|nr:uncharacterized protein LOC128180476 [Crassostrea angulata]
MDNVKGQLIDEPKIITYIQTSYDNSVFDHDVVCLNDEKVWTSGIGSVIRLYNLHGEVLDSIDIRSGEMPEKIAVTKDGDLVYVDVKDKAVNMVKNRQTETVIRRRGWSPTSVCSTSSGDLLVIMISDDIHQIKVMRYCGCTETQCIQYDDSGLPLYSLGGVLNMKHICENRNLDICVSDYDNGVVVVVSQAGKLRFTYTGPPSMVKKSFHPVGITTDSQSRILVADMLNNRIHILDKDGYIIRFISNCNLRAPLGLCVDTKDYLFVTERDTGKVKKIQYCIPSTTCKVTN